MVRRSDRTPLDGSVGYACKHQTNGAEAATIPAAGSEAGRDHCDQTSAKRKTESMREKLQVPGPSAGSGVTTVSHCSGSSM